jgi:hypothetical protein
MDRTPHNSMRPTGTMFTFMFRVPSALRKPELPRTIGSRPLVARAGSYTLPTTTGQPTIVMKVDSGAGAVTVLPGTGTINVLNSLANTYWILINPGQFAELFSMARTIGS